MTVRIRIRDFQSIEDAEIEVTGLTVITGANNTGKSAALRAVHGAFTNARGFRFVRHGKDFCTVDVTFSDGRSLTWVKGEKTNRYVVDGKTLDKVGQAVPLEVESLGVVPITASGRELWPQFAQQFTGQVFLLDQPGSVLAESISDVTRVGVLNDALRNTQSDRRALASELKLRLSDVGRLELAEASFAGLDLAEALAVQAEACREDVTQTTQHLEGVRVLRGAYVEHVTTVTDLQPVRAVVVPGGAEALQVALEDVQAVRDLRGKLVGASASVAGLAPVRDVSLPDDVSVQRAGKIAEALSLLTDLRGQMRPLQALVKEAQAVRAKVSLELPDVGPVDVQTLDECRGLRTALRTQVRLAEALKLEADSVNTQYEAALHEVRDLLGSAGSCPICGT